MMWQPERVEWPIFFRANERWFVSKLCADVWNHVILPFLPPRERTAFRPHCEYGCSQYLTAWEELVDYPDEMFQLRLDDKIRVHDLQRVYRFKRKGEYPRRIGEAKTNAIYIDMLFPGKMGEWEKYRETWLQVIRVPARFSWSPYVEQRVSTFVYKSPSS